MIKEGIVQVRLNPANRKHYEAFGYTGEMGEFIDILTTHLTKSSEVKVTRICDSCGSEEVVSKKKASPVCQKCKVAETRIPDSDKKGYSPCKDCGVYVKNAKRCKPCHSLFMVGENNPNFGNGDKIRGENNANWKGGKPKCIDCGNDLANNACVSKDVKRCRPCHNTWHVGANVSTYKHSRNFCKCGAKKSRGDVCWDCYKEEVHNPNAVKRSNSDSRWSKEIRELANYECDCCGSSDDLCAHHLEAFMDNEPLRRELANGVCLCRLCHLSFHKTYGFGSNTTEQYLEFKEIYHGSN